MHNALGYIVSILIAAAIGYLFGSFNGGIVSVRLLKHEDIRKFGSGNAGLTNVLRCFGKVCGICTLIIDLGKGAAAMALAQFVCRQLAWAPLSEGTGEAYDYRWLCYVAAIFVVLGHVFPIWHGFRGGKGVLVGVSVFLVINPLTFVILMAVFGLILWRSKYVSLASCIATLSVIPVTVILEHFVRGAYWSVSLLYTALIAVPAFLIVYSHHENIERLRNGTERRITDKKEKAPPAAQELSAAPPAAPESPAAPPAAQEPPAAPPAAQEPPAAPPAAQESPAAPPAAQEPPAVPPAAQELPAAPPAAPEKQESSASGRGVIEMIPELRQKVIERYDTMLLNALRDQYHINAVLPSEQPLDSDQLTGLFCSPGRARVLECSGEYYCLEEGGWIWPLIKTETGFRKDTDQTRHLLWHNRLRGKRILAIATDGTHLYYIETPVTYEVQHWHGYLDSTDPEFQRTELFDSFEEIAAAVKEIAPEQLEKELLKIQNSSERCWIGGNEYDTDTYLVSETVVMYYDPVRQLKILRYTEGDTHVGFQISERFFIMPDGGCSKLRPDHIRAMQTLCYGEIPGEALMILLPEKTENRDESLLKEFYC